MLNNFTECLVQKNVQNNCQKKIQNCYAQASNSCNVTEGGESFGP